MPRVQLFLSTVSAEFLSYRERLRRLLTRPDVEVKVQEDFIVTGDETLEILDRYIQGCDGVIHLVGDMTGAMAKPQSVEAITQRYPELANRLPLAEFLQPDGPSLSYTQWEAWLALHHGKPLFIATPTPEAPRDRKHVREPDQQELQRAHLGRLRGVGRYPGTVFTGLDHLAVEVFRSFVLDLLKKAGVSPNLYSPHNLPDRTTSADRFVGREAELQRLAELLAPEGSRVYLTGMGGVGKSELALQHAYDHLEHYSGGIVRLDARQGLVAMASQVVSFVRGTFPEVNLPEDQSKSPIELLPLCWSQWPAGATPPEPVLLILDDQRGDAEGYAAERQLLAGLPPRFRRLVTQREPAPTGAKAIDLPLLQREASLELLALQAGEGGPERLQAEPQAADGLSEEVGDLPLALVLLGARLSERPDLRLSKLLEELRAKGAEAKALQQAHPELGAQRGVVEALLISWEPLSPAAKSLGVLLGVMAPAVIPWELVEACRLPEQEVEEGSAFGEQQSELWRAQLLERVGEGMYRLHPLVRQFIRLQSRDQEAVATAWRGQLAAVMSEICRHGIPQMLTLEQVERLEPVLPHIRQVAEHCAEELSEEDLLWPFTGLARVANYQAVFAEALHWGKEALAECERRLGTEHPSTAVALNNLAQTLQETNRLVEAEPLMRRALAIDEASYAPDHPEVVISLNNLAMLLKETNRPAEAEQLMRRALLIDESSFGPNHPRVANLLNNLALILERTSSLEATESLLRTSLAIDDANSCHHPPIMAIRLNNLAGFLMHRNRIMEAELMAQSALAICERNYGAFHPMVALCLNTMALLLKDTNRLAEAEPLMWRMLEINEDSYGLEHPIVATDLNDLAMLLKDTNRLAEAEPLILRALAIDEASYGPDHPSVARDLSNQAQLLHVKNNLAGAENLARKALHILEASPNENDPNIGGALNNLARILQDSNRLTDAEVLMRRSLAIDEAIYGSEHPHVAIRLNNLATILQDANRLAEAEPLMRRNVAILMAFLRQGYQHPNLEAGVNNYGNLLHQMGHSEAEIQSKLQSLLPEPNVPPAQ